MMVTLNINRMKRGDEIWETFTTNPKHPYLKDPKRSIYFELWLQRNIHSIHHIYPLKKILELKDTIIYIYEYRDTKEQPQLNEIITIKYSPVLGSKKCSTCENKLSFPQGDFCFKRGTKLNKNSWYKCLYWQEKNLIKKGRNYGGIFR